MRFNITKIELWFWRIAIIGLIIFCGILAQGNRQAQEMGLKNITLIDEQAKEIGKLTSEMNTNQLAIIQILNIIKK